MDTLLINPPSKKDLYGAIGWSVPPLGLAYIAAVLREHGHQVKIVDMDVEDIDYHTYPYHDFDLTGISVDTARYPVSLQIAKAAKKQGVKVVMGGPHVTFFDRESLETGVVDYVVRNEGEYIMLDLVETLSKGGPIEQVKGISYVAEGEFIKNPPAPFIEDLDRIPFPARDLLPTNRYIANFGGQPTMTIITSRGCPFGCEFCSSSQFSGIKWRTRSVGNILEEMGLLYDKYGYRAIAFVDDNFTLSKDRVIKLCTSIIENGWQLIWLALSRVDTIVKNVEMVELMAKAGLRMVFLGFESASQEVLDKYGKKFAVTTAMKAMDILKRNGVKVWGSFMIGEPSETKEMIKQTIRFARRLNPYYAQFTILTPYPGTRLYQRVKDRLLTKDWELYSTTHSVIKLDNLTAEEVEGLLRKAYSSFYIRPRRPFTQLHHPLGDSKKLELLLAGEPTAVLSK